MRTVERIRIPFVSAARANATYNGSAYSGSDIHEANMYIDVTGVGTGGKLDVTVEGAATEADVVAGKWHNILTVPQISTTGSKDVIALVNLAAFYRVVSVISDLTAGSFSHSIKISEQVRI